MDQNRIIIDFESTIADLTECHKTAFTKSFKEFDMDFDPSRLDEYIHTPLEILFEKYQRGCTCRFRDFVIMTIAEFDSSLDECAIISRKTIESLIKLRNEGRRFGILSECSEEQVHRVLSKFGIDELFDSVVGIERMAIRRPEAYPIMICMREMNADKENTVLISTEERDRIAAEKAGIVYKESLMSYL